MVLKLFKNRFLFTIWFGIGAPVYFLTALVALFYQNLTLALVLAILYIWRVYDSFTTTCSRCPHYGTGNCGIPGKLVPYFFEKKTDVVSQKRVRLHFYTDLIFTFGVLLIYFHLTKWGWLAAIWPVGAVLISFGPKRYHGLLYQLRSSELNYVTTKSNRKQTNRAFATDSSASHQ